jgi:general secretion pathway protein A
LYEQYYGLSARPFEIGTTPPVLVLTDTHREALSTLQYGLRLHKGITLLVGEPGMGKSMLLRHALMVPPPANEPPPLFICLNNPTLNRRELLAFLAEELSLSRPAARCKTRFLREFAELLNRQRAEGGVAALIIDEAQSLPDELMEEVRLLANLEMNGTRWLSIVLAGQPALAERLNQPWLQQLKQRIGLRCVLAPLALHESAAYIAARIHAAGGEGGRLFTAEAVRLIHQYSAGVPRTLNVICDNALLTGLALATRPVDSDVVLEVSRELDLVSTDRAVPQSRHGTRRFALASLLWPRQSHRAAV